MVRHTGPKREIPVDVESAFHFIVKSLRKDAAGCANYGYDLYLHNVIYKYVAAATGTSEHDSFDAPETSALSPHFMNAAWEMARRGILRPGVKTSGQQTTDHGGGGCGFSITDAGKTWLEESGQYDFVPTEPGRFAKQLDSFTPRFGDSFQERAQEAIRCYGANAYLACCAMAGAAAESIVLALAIAKDGDAAKVEKEYLASGGRGRVEKAILIGQPANVQAELRGYTSLLKYWRDAAAHGHRLGLSDNEAFTSLAVLLRFAQFASDRWAELTARPTPPTP